MAASHKRESGYTLIELLVVLAILGLLATIATTQVLRYYASAKLSAARAQVEAFRQHSISTSSMWAVTPAPRKGWRAEGETAAGGQLERTLR